MTKDVKDVPARAEIDREVQAGIYRATDEELRKIDEALAAVRRGEVAADNEVEAVLAKHHGV